MNSSEAINALRSTSKRSQCDHRSVKDTQLVSGRRLRNSQSVFGAEKHTETESKVMVVLEVK